MKLNVYNEQKERTRKAMIKFLKDAYKEIKPYCHHLDLMDKLTSNEAARAVNQYFERKNRVTLEQTGSNAG